MIAPPALSSMEAVRYFRKRLQRKLFDFRFRDWPERQRGELYWWHGQLQRIRAWYEGRKVGVDWFDNKPLSDADRITGHSPLENAIRTWVQRDVGYYPGALRVSADHFAGMRVCDLGCGPIPSALAFTDCQIFGVDRLVKGYKALGYPLDTYPKRMTYINGSAENIPVEDHFFDAVISVNALDHVDNFPAAASEICRVLRRAGGYDFKFTITNQPSSNHGR